jgi:hypothetical protein
MSMSPWSKCGLRCAMALSLRKKVAVCTVLSLVFPDPGTSGMILTFGDVPLTNTVSRLCPRCFATTPRRLLLGKGGPQGPGHD